MKIVAYDIVYKLISSFLNELFRIACGNLIQLYMIIV